MIVFPEDDYFSSEVLADWIECNAINDGFVARGDAVDQCKDSALWKSGEHASDVATTSPADAVADAWASLGNRRLELKEAWPFDLNTGIISYRENPVYAALLCLDLMRNYSGKVQAVEDSVRTLFEHVVTESVATLFGGLACRFGAPFPANWPSTFPKRVTRLAHYFGLESNEKKTAELASGRQQDDGLDVVGRLKLGDERPGTLYVLVQCATGANWRSKCGEPSIEKWKKYIDWNANTVRAIAIPWVLRSRSELSRASLHFDGAIVLDRWRIVAGKPDKTLAAEHRRALGKWVRARLKVMAKY